SLSLQNIGKQLNSCRFGLLRFYFYACAFFFNGMLFLMVVLFDEFLQEPVDLQIRIHDLLLEVFVGIPLLLQGKEIIFAPIAVFGQRGPPQDFLFVNQPFSAE
ncbi:hypothetical protein, partial [Chryseobacterium taklimakanense]|uniref:hypothetical protein n=1 Tax=Chryseobacterium taklimakanense TaxID=536441 RepID=UPI001EF60558